MRGIEENPPEYSEYPELPVLPQLEFELELELELELCILTGLGTRNGVCTVQVQVQAQVQFSSDWIAVEPKSGRQGLDLGQDPRPCEGPQLWFSSARRNQRGKRKRSCGAGVGEQLEKLKDPFHTQPRAATCSHIMKRKAYARYS